MDPTFRHFDSIVVGGGPAGLAAALALAETGAATALVARRQPYADNRTTALLGGSVSFLQKLDVWRALTLAASPLRTMRLVDATNRLIRAPEVRFDANELGQAQFGFNVANRDLVAALEKRAGEASELTRFDDDAHGVTLADDRGMVVATGETITASLIVAADGRQSTCRDAAGISVTRRALPQMALTFNIAHSRPHDGISTEFHTANGPCVFVPLPGNGSSVVWVTSPAEAQRLASLGDDDLAQAAEAHSHYVLGKATIEGERHVFPLAIEKPSTIATNRVALIGEAAHVLPPIGAQGLNLGLRDAADLAEIVGAAWRSTEDVGSAAVLARYVRRRAGDIAVRMAAVDAANRTLLSPFLPAQAARAAGMHVLAALGPLRRFAMRQGLGGWSAPPES